MDRRSILRLAAMALMGLCLILPASRAMAQQSADMEGVKAASKAFYEALAVLDDGEAMAKVWAHTPYVTFVGPRSKSIIVGWDAQQKYWPEANKVFSSRNVSLSGPHIHINGNLAWEMGHEIAEVKMQDGSVSKTDRIVTNVYEKQPDGRWLMVSHHVQPKPE